MKLKSLLCTFASAIALGCSGLAAAQTPKLGVDYAAYTPPQPTEAPAGKIEVTEFFFYTCPHCADMEPLIEKWAKALPKDVSLRRVPVLFRPQFAPYSKLFYTLEAMNLLDKLHSEVFVALHEKRINLADEKVLGDWLGSKGVDATKFFEIYNSFAIASKVERGNQLTKAHEIPGTPAIVVNGQYLVTSVGSHERELQVASYLIDRVRSEQKKAKTK